MTFAIHMYYRILNIAQYAIGAVITLITIVFGWAIASGGGITGGSTLLWGGCCDLGGNVVEKCHDLSSD